MKLAEKLQHFKQLLIMYHWLARSGMELVFYLKDGRKPEQAKKLLDSIIKPFEKGEKKK